MCPAGLGNQHLYQSFFLLEFNWEVQMAVKTRKGFVSCIESNWKWQGTQISWQLALWCVEGFFHSLFSLYFWLSITTERWIEHCSCNADQDFHLSADIDKVTFPHWCETPENCSCLCLAKHTFGAFPVLITVQWTREQFVRYLSVWWDCL